MTGAITLHRVVLDPVTKIEGHGVLEIDFSGGPNVTVRLMATELRGFEKICVGRPIEEMPRLVSRICGMCPAAHHVAAARAADDIFEIEPPSLAHRLRELALCLQLIQSHLTHFYLLALPELIYRSEPAERNFFRVMEELGPEASRYILEQRSYAGKILALLGGKGIHPEFAVPGGVSSTLSAAELYQVQAILRSLLSFGLYTLDLFRERVVNKSPEVVSGDAVSDFRTYYLARVLEGCPNLYEGELVLVSPEGCPVEHLIEAEYAERLEGGREAGNYAESFSFLSRDGQRILVQVGPLARANAAHGFSTPKAAKAYEEMLRALGPKPIRGEIAYHWARLVEVIYAAERALELTAIDQPDAKEIRVLLPTVRGGSGVGVVEAPRGLLLHRYEVDDAGIVQQVRIVTPTAVNLRAIDQAATAAARKALASGDEQQAIFRAENAVRAFDPCLSCATHIIRYVHSDKGGEEAGSE